MWSKLLSWDRARGLQVWMDVDEDDQVVFRHVDLNWRHVIEHNRQLANATPKNVHAGNTQRHFVKVAELPLHVYQQLVASGRIRDQAAMRKFLNDPDNRFLRTYDGRL